METKGKDSVAKQKEMASGKHFQCGKCDKVFKQQYLLKRHSVVHTGERKFVCSVCGKTFKLRSTLNHHNATHAEDKLFACTLCPQQFSRASTLRTHMAIHAKAKNFQCNVCGNNFVQKGNLASHMNVHSNKRPYKCTLCGCGFNQQSNLRSHILTTHAEGKDCVWSEPLPNTKKTVKRHDLKGSIESKRTNRKSGIESGTSEHKNMELEIRQQMFDPEFHPQTTEQNTLRADSTAVFQDNSPILPILDREPQQLSSLRLIQSNNAPGLLILVDDLTGEIMPVIQRDQVFQVINANDLDSLPDAQQVACDPNPSASTSALSNLCLDDMLSERFDSRTIQNEPSLMFCEGLEETMKWYNNMCTE